jgi:hypothetical protein
VVGVGVAPAQVGVQGQVRAIFCRTPRGRLTLTPLSAEQAGALAAHLAGLGHSPSDVIADHDTATAFAETWQRHTGASPVPFWRARLYRLGTLTPPQPRPGGRGRIAGEHAQPRSDRQVRRQRRRERNGAVRLRELAAAAEALRARHLDVGGGLLDTFLDLIVTELKDRADDLATHGHVLPGALEALTAVKDLPGVHQSVLTGNLYPLAVLSPPTRPPTANDSAAMAAGHRPLTATPTSNATRSSVASMNLSSGAAWPPAKFFTVRTVPVAPDAMVSTTSASEVDWRSGPSR